MGSYKFEFEFQRRTAGHSELIHDAWQMKPFEMQQIVTAMQISDNIVEVEDLLLCRE